MYNFLLMLIGDYLIFIKRILGSKSFNKTRLFVPITFGILAMVFLNFMLPSKRAEVTKVIETTTSTSFEYVGENEIETKETTTTTLATEDESESSDATVTTTTEKETNTSTTILPGDPLCEELGCPYGTNFVGSKNSDLYHYCHCSSAKRIKEENLVCFFTEEEAQEKGYTQSSCKQTTTTTSTTTTITISSTTSSTTTTETTTTSTTVATTSTTSTTEEPTTTTSTTTSSTTTTIPVATDVVINEVMYDPSGTDTGKEWIELYNKGDSDINMMGYCLYASGEHYVFEEFTLNSGSFVVIYWNKDGTDNNTDLYSGTTGWSNMGNTKGSVVLFNTHISHTQNTIIDFIQYGEGGQTWESAAMGAGIWTEDDFISDVEEEHSIARHAPGHDSNSPDDFYDESSPSPGQQNKFKS
jgi:hypothetical protein